MSGKPTPKSWGARGGRAWNRHQFEMRRSQKHELMLAAPPPDWREYFDLPRQAHTSCRLPARAFQPGAVFPLPPGLCCALRPCPALAPAAATLAPLHAGSVPSAAAAALSAGLRARDRSSTCHAALRLHLPPALEDQESLDSPRVCACDERLCDESSGAEAGATPRVMCRLVYCLTVITPTYLTANSVGHPGTTIRDADASAALLHAALCLMLTPLPCAERREKTQRRRIQHR
jgi:hypothetical protein